jgi:hypothetical protein
VSGREEWAELKFGSNAADVAQGLLVVSSAGRIDMLEPVVRAWSAGRLGELELRAYWGGELDSGHPYVYGDSCVPGTTCGKNIDHYLFQSTRADGTYLFGSHHGPTLPRFWVDWYPMSRENAWVALACLHLYGRLAGDRLSARSLEIADRAARGALLLQADTGGIRMSTMGTWSGTDTRRWFNVTLTADSIVWHSVFRRLHAITGNTLYEKGARKIESFLARHAYDSRAGIFLEGLQWNNGVWTPLSRFDTQCQLWAILAFGSRGLADILHIPDAHEKIWSAARSRAGIFDNGSLCGFDFTDYRENPEARERGALVSSECLAAAVLAARALGASQDESSLTTHALSSMRNPFPGESAWPCIACSSTKAHATGLGWNTPSCEVLHLGSTAWMVFVLGAKPLNPLADFS